MHPVPRAGTTRTWSVARARRRTGWIDSVLVAVGYVRGGDRFRGYGLINIKDADQWLSLGQATAPVSPTRSWTP
jgi:hypothetical protein